jgi:hypothetical protein
MTGRALTASAGRRPAAETGTEADGSEGREEGREVVITTFRPDLGRYAVGQLLVFDAVRWEEELCSGLKKV